MQIDFERERDWWNDKAIREEIDRADEIINRTLRWQIIKEHLVDVSTVLAIGGGTGAFSILLAEEGYQVTHVDFAPEMLKIAKKKSQNLSNIQFEETNAINLGRFQNQSFDLVLNMDGAISFCGSKAKDSISESCRVTKKRLIITVSNRAKLIAATINACIQATGEITPAVYEMMTTGNWNQNQFENNDLLSKNSSQGYFGVLKAFTPDELYDILEKFGMSIIHCGTVGTLAHLCEPDVINTILQKKELLKKFLDICTQFDHEIMPYGVGTRERAGLIAVAKPKDETK
ncbi:MAG: class I SAM-dependent methyltransferase [Candidatus Hodarchaeales archaeon]|jgi:ubiquinone/menaquinone biosynthesis C-methylase UbiE